jgi:hypothetical protein
LKFSTIDQELLYPTSPKQAATSTTKRNSKGETMTDMKVSIGAVVVFTTKSDDYNSKVVGPEVSAALRSQDRVPTGKAGFYTVVVVDRQLRAVDVLLAGTDAATAQPKSVARENNEMVTVVYEVA